MFRVPLDSPHIGRCRYILGLSTALHSSSLPWSTPSKRWMALLSLGIEPHKTPHPRMQFAGIFLGPLQYRQVHQYGRSTRALGCTMPAPRLHLIPGPPPQTQGPRRNGVPRGLGIFTLVLSSRLCIEIPLRLIIFPYSSLSTLLDPCRPPTSAAISHYCTLFRITSHFFPLFLSLS